MIIRPAYIEAVRPFMDQPLVKILAGVRRCGKSTIFEMLADEFRRRGIPEDHIIQKRYTAVSYTHLRGRGIPELRGRGRGDQYVTVRVQVPTSLTAEQKEALHAFGEAMGEAVPEGGLKGFFDTVSYTHLDVYKRQVWYSSPALTVAFGSKIHRSDKKFSSQSSRCL